METLMPDSGQENGISRESFKEMDQNLREWTLYNRMTGLVVALREQSARCPRQVEVCRSEFKMLSVKIDAVSRDFTDKLDAVRNDLTNKIECVRRKTLYKYERLVWILSGLGVLCVGVGIGLGLLSFSFIRDHIVPWLGN